LSARQAQPVQESRERRPGSRRGSRRHRVRDARRRAARDRQEPAVMTRSTVADRAACLQATLAGNTLPTLDGYRAVGIFLVAADHFGFNAPGGLALTGFFALSGFLITWLLRKEQNATGAISIRQFYLRRMLRILPAYYVYVGLSLATVAFLGRPLPYGMVSSSMLYVANYYNAFNGHPPGPFSHLWSLAVEEQIYLL